MPVVNLPATYGQVRAALNATGLRKNTFDATRVPATTDNAAAGYEIGSRWINTTTGVKWTLTGFSSSNAVWTLDSASAASGEEFTTGEKTKLSGIATGATANSTDAQLLARAQHTGTQAISTVTGLQAVLDEKLLASLVTAFALTLLNDADAATMRTTLGLGSIALLSSIANANLSNGAVSNAKMASMATMTMKGNVTGATAVPTDLTATQAKTLLAIAMADVSGLVAALSAKADTSHTQAIGTVTGLQAALDAKVAGLGITIVQSITQAAYDALTPKVATTLYVVTA